MEVAEAVCHTCQKPGPAQVRGRSLVMLRHHSTGVYGPECPREQFCPHFKCRGIGTEGSPIGARTSEESNELKHQFTWSGERARSLALYRPCPCGCDERLGDLGVGYISGSDSRGNGVTIWIESEEVFLALSSLLPEGIVGATQRG